MRRKFVRNRHTLRRELVVSSQQGEALNTHRAKWLADCASPVLLRFDYDLARDGIGATLHYDVNGLVSLKSYLKKQVLDDACLVNLMVSVQEVLDTCARKVPTELIYFDPKLVFVDNRAQPRFVIVPLDNTTYEVGNSALTMLKALGNPRRLLFTSPSAQLISSALEAFVLEQNNTFSYNKYRDFLDSYVNTRRTSTEVQHKKIIPLSSETNADEMAFRMWNPLDGWGSQRPQRTQNTYRLERLATGESYPMEASRPIEVGRGSHCDVQITGNPKLSRTHARLDCSGSTVTIVDLGSANGTWVQERRLVPQSGVAIPLGAKFSLANEVFEVQRD